jgi:hypothetical protein
MSDGEILALEDDETEMIAQLLVCDLLAVGRAKGHRCGTFKCEMQDGTEQLIEWSIDYAIVMHGPVAGCS